MLDSVYIENIALIKKLSLDIPAGFTAFTGETGAGKSIIIDAMQLLCGARSDRAVIRHGESEALVEGIFGVSGTEAISALAENDITPDEDGTVTVTRRLSADGRSSAKINGRAVPVSRLKAVVSALMSIHGQQDTLALSDRARQLAMLDSFAGDEAERGEYSKQYGIYTDIAARLALLEEKNRERDYRLDMLRYRMGELKRLALREGEKEELEARRAILANSEKIAEKSAEAYNLLYAGDNSATESVSNALNALNALRGIIPEVEALCERLDAAECEIKDIAVSLGEYTESENTGMSLDETESRLEAIRRMESKLGTDASGFGALMDEWQSEIESFENSEELQKQLRAEQIKAAQALRTAAKALSNTRKAAARRLCERVCGELAAVDMPGVTFTVDFREKEPSPTGTDEIDFLIGANRGELPGPISKIASGGELSRIMLCLKCVFADSESIGTLIFDEIDTGVSGGTGEKIGARLKLAAGGGRTQVICVTHSALIAAKADSHFRISKSVSGERTETHIERLEGAARRSELARLMGGTNITDSVLTAVDELLERG